MVHLLPGRLILRPHLLCAHMVSSHQRSFSHKIGHNGLTDDSELGPGLNYFWNRRDCVRILFSVHGHSFYPYGGRSWNDEHMDNTHQSFNVDWLSSHLRFGRWFRHAATVRAESLNIPIEHWLTNSCSLMAAQTVLSLDDIPIGTTIIIFVQTLGGALFISVGQNIFTNQLMKNLIKDVPSIDPELVLHTGATLLRKAVDPALLDDVLTAYNSALTQTFYVSTAVAALSIFGSALIEWRSVKGKKLETVAA